MGWFQKLIYGVDLDEEQARSDTLDSQLAEQNRIALESGHYTQAIFDEAEANRMAGRVNVNAEVNDAFQEGLDEGAQRIRDAVGGTINSAITAPLKVIPWQLWVAVGFFVAFKFGLFDPLLARWKR